QGLEAPPPVSGRARWVWLGGAALAALVALGVRLSSGKIAAAMIATGLTATQARTFLLDLVLGSLGFSAACLAVGSPGRLGAWGARRFSLPIAGGRGAFSLSLVAGLMPVLPFTLALIAGALGQAIALPRSFIATAPFVTLLLAQGLASLPAWPRALVGTLVM